MRLFFVLCLVAGAGSVFAASTNESKGVQVATNKLSLTDAEWKARLTPEQYRILRQQGTERAFSGALWNHFDEGTYQCAGCGEVLFESSSKFDSHCGWPSFDQAAASNRIEYLEDRSHGMIRTEVRCARCGGHLGHVFDDGPTKTRQRYCINSLAIGFEKRAGSPEKK